MRVLALVLVMFAASQSVAEERRFGIQLEVASWVPDDFSARWPVQLALGVEYRLPHGFLLVAQVGGVLRNLVNEGFVRGEAGWRKRWQSGVTFEAKLGLGLQLQYTTGTLYREASSGEVLPQANTGLLAGTARLWLGPGYAFANWSLSLGFFMQVRGPQWQGVGLEPGLGLRVMVL